MKYVLFKSVSMKIKNRIFMPAYNLNKIPPPFSSAGCSSFVEA
jgi:hypothetical protein